MPTLSPRSPVRSKEARAAARRRNIVAAILAAVLFHVAFLLLLAWGLPHWPRPPIHRRGPIQLLIQGPEPSPTPPAGPSDTGTPQAPYFRTIDENKSDTPPPDPNFQSDKNTLASATKAAEDMNKPLPSQDGSTIPTFDFDTTPYRPGKEASSAASAAAPATEQVPPMPSPSKEKTPVSKRTKPDSASREKPTPPPQNAEPTPTPGELITIKPDATPSESPPEPSESPMPTANSSPPPPPPPAAQTPRVGQASTVSSTGMPQRPGYQPQSIQSKMSGSIDNRGRSSVAALGTPLGRYEKMVSDAIGARWYYNVNENMSTLIHTGDVKIHFFVSRSGHAISARITGPNNNTALADISIEAVTEAELPPIPDDVAALLPAGQLEVEYSFGMY